MNDDVEKQQREQKQQTLKDGELLESLMNHPGWERYMTLIEAVGQNFAHTALQQLESVLDLPKAEFAKGALKGLQTAAALPRLKITEANEYKRMTADGE